MVLRKKWLVMLSVVTTALLLTACGDKESSGATPAQDGSQDSSAEDPMVISEGFEDYSVWFETCCDALDRNNSVTAIYVFENGEATGYYNISGQAQKKIEEINDLTDDEIVQYAKEVATMKDIGKYTLDITLDSLGQGTEKIDVILENYTHIWTFDIDSLSAEKGLTDEEYIASLEDEGDKEFEINGEYITFTSTEEEPKSMFSINGAMVSQTIFDTTYSGLKSGDYNSIVTRVDDSFLGFEVDGVDTDKPNVTIEEYK